MAEPARVKVEYAFKVNLGNFENVEVRVGVEDSVREGETVKVAYERIDKFVSERVANEVAEARDLGGK
jgi:hypothetical protein